MQLSESLGVHAPIAGGDFGAESAANAIASLVFNGEHEQKGRFAVSGRQVNEELVVLADLGGDFDGKDLAGGGGIDGILVIEA